MTKDQASQIHTEWKELIAILDDLNQRANAMNAVIRTIEDDSDSINWNIVLE